MNLLKANTTSSTTITVKDDIPSTAADIEEFVDAYNDMVEFVNESNRVVRESEDEDSLNIFSPLALTTLDDNMIANIRTEIAKATAGNDVSGSNFEVNIFANIGITTERDGTLLFNPDATVSTDNQGFETAMNADPESVRRLLQNFAEEVATLNTAGGVIHQYTAFNGLFDQAETNNKDNIRSLNDRIARQEAAILRREDALRAQFARLERTTAELQSQQGALTSALAGLG